LVTGILLCVIALVIAVVSLIVCVVRTGLTAAVRDWPFWLIVAVVLTEIALLWGNIGVIYSHAGLTG
jgi:hypothetical protein